MPPSSIHSQPSRRAQAAPLRTLAQPVAPQAQWILAPAGKTIADGLQQVLQRALADVVGARCQQPCLRLRREQRATRTFQRRKQASGQGIATRGLQLAARGIQLRQAPALRPACFSPSRRHPPVPPTAWIAAATSRSVACVSSASACCGNSCVTSVAKAGFCQNRHWWKASASIAASQASASRRCRGRLASLTAVSRLGVAELHVLALVDEAHRGDVAAGLDQACALHMRAHRPA